jgi:hypothetical protein
VACALLLGCGSGTTPAGGVAVTTPTGPDPGNGTGACAVPAEAAAEDVSRPTTVVGTGRPETCTPDAFEGAVQRGGIVTFDCGPDPVTITLPREIRLLNDVGVGGLGDRVIDGGGKVTLSGGGRNRILYQDGCDESLHWITSHCQDFPHPRLVLQNLRFQGGVTTDPTHGGGAVFARSGQLKIVNSVFVGNRCADVGPDVAGGAVYALQQAGPVHVVNSTFGGGAGLGNVGSNGGALGSIGVSWVILNSVLSHNQAVGTGMNAVSPFGGNGGAIYNDGNTFTLAICGTEVSSNAARELAGAVFFVSNDRTGSMSLDRSTFRANTGRSDPGMPGFFVLAAGTTITGTHIE